MTPRMHPALGAVMISLTVGTASLASPVPTGDEFQVNTYTTSAQDYHSVAGMGDGGFVVVWESNGNDGSLDGIFMQRYDADGNVVGGEVQVNSYTTGNQHDPAIAVGDDGAFIIVWDSGNFQDGDQRGIFGQRYDASSNPLGGEFQVNAVGDGDQNDAVVAKFSDGGFVVAWEDNQGMGAAEDLVGRRFDSSGDPVGDEFDINDFVTDDQEDVDIATDAADNFVVAWESDFQDGHFDAIVVQRFDSDAVPLTGEIVVNTYTTGDQDDPSLAVHPDGSFVVVWEDDAQFGPDERAFARFFDSTGSPITDEVEVSMVADQVNPRVAVDGDGEAVVTWDSAGPDGDGVGIFARTFDAAGAAIDDEFQVNITTAGNQGYPVITASGDQFLISWVDFGGDGSGPGVFARRIANGIFDDGFESGATSSWSSATTP